MARRARLALLTPEQSDALDRLTANGETVSAAVGAAIVLAADELATRDRA